MKLKYVFFIVHTLSAMAASLLTAACAEDDFVIDRPEAGDGPVTLSFVCNDMLPQYVDPVASRSRAADPKTEEEKEIKSLHVFFFDGTTGAFVRPKLDDQKFLPYQYIPNPTNLITVGEEVFTNMTNVTVVAIANIDATEGNHPYFNTEWSTDGDIRQNTREASGEYWRIEKYDDLKQWIYHPELRADQGRSITELPSAGMPMIGAAENRSLLKTADNPRLEVQLKALMARVNISVKLTPNQESRDGALPSMTITSFGIKNMPQTVPFVRPTAEPVGSPADKRYDLTGGGMDTLITYTLPAPVTINKNSEPVTFSYYTYENIQLPDYEATRPGANGAFFPGYGGGSVSSDNINYPDGIEDNERQRWKPLMARDEASAMVLNASYVTHQNLRYQARFTVYMGANPDNDFKVERNHAYNNNITIRGLDYVRNSSDNVYTFDGRVNVITDNPIYFAIVNERKIDAHATALPMDVWFLLREEAEGGGDAEHDWESTVTLSLTDPQGNTPDWIRMEKVPRAVMKAGGWEPGTGARPYFTENLVTKTLKDNRTIVIDGNTDKSRTRVYFYIDENVPTSNNPTDYGDRYATVYITYENSYGDRRTRTLEIEQRALVHVTDTHSSSGEAMNTWMEYYEEYLEHNDPLDSHTMPGELYEGLPWGVEGTNYGNWHRSWDRLPWDRDYDTISDDLYYSSGAFDMTKYIIERQGADPLSNLKLFNDEAPKTAFHYCYGKNKRETGGNVSTSKRYGWYMPGIRELETALTQYYNTFDDFRGNFYWSCAAAKLRTNDLLGYTREDYDRARATKVATDANGQPILSGGKATYAESGSYNDDHNYREPVNGIEQNYGRAPRSKTFRIRAFYKVK